MQGAEPQQEDRTTVAEQTGKSDTGSGQIIIYDNDSNLRKVLKAEQWCKQLLGVTEVDYTWCIRLGTPTLTCASMTLRASSTRRCERFSLRAESIVF